MVVMSISKIEALIERQKREIAVLSDVVKAYTKSRPIFTDADDQKEWREAVQTMVDIGIGEWV